MAYFKLMFVLWKHRGEYGKVSGSIQRGITKKVNFELVLERYVKIGQVKMMMKYTERQNVKRQSTVRVMIYAEDGKCLLCFHCWILRRNI